jgi:hypothetical protein
VSAPTPLPATPVQRTIADLDVPLETLVERLRAGRLAEQRHQVEDPAEPEPAAYIWAPFMASEVRHD